jgi:hypothetical protein
VAGAAPGPPRRVGPPTPRTAAGTTDLDALHDPAVAPGT